MTTNSIKAVTFDVGGVIQLHLGGNLRKKLAKAIGVPEADFMKAYFRHNHLSNVKNLKWSETLLQVVKEFDPSPRAEEITHRLYAEHEANKALNRELISWFPKLTAAGYQLGILSNNTTDLRPWLEENDILRHMDAVVISAEVGYQKPHREAFDFLFEKLGREPGEVIFVDDSPKSLEKAEEIGYIPVRFTDNDSLKAELARLGVNF